MTVVDPDLCLLPRLQARDHATQAALLHAHRPTLERLVTRITGSASEAESLVADLFADFFFKHVDQVRTARAIPAYLRIMAVRRARRLHTQAARSEELREETLAHTSDTRVDEEADRRSYRAWLSECLKRLSARARLVLKLHYGDGLSYSEVGNYQSCSKQAVGKVMTKSLLALRQCLEAQAELATRRATVKVSP